MPGIFTGIFKTIAHLWTAESLEWARLPLYLLFFVRQTVIVPDYRPSFRHRKTRDKKRRVL